MTLLHTTETVTAPSPSDFPNVIILNPRSPVTGIAVDHGFSDNGRKAFIRWSTSTQAGYTQWHEILLTPELRHEYSHAVDFSL